MRISAKNLKNVQNVNSWSYANQTVVEQGNAADIYFQLVDLDQSTKINGEQTPLPEHPIRYIPKTPVSLKAIFQSLEDDEQFEVVATNPFPEDLSIFKFSLTSSQTPRSGSVVFELTEMGVSKKFIVTQAISSNSLEIGGC